MEYTDINRVNKHPEVLQQPMVAGAQVVLNYLARV